MNPTTRFYLPTAADIHLGWLRPVFGTAAGQLKTLLRGRHARRLAARTLREEFPLGVAAPRELSERTAWLLWSPGRQRALARELGVAAHATFIRRAIMAEAVAKLQQALGEDGYTQAVQTPELCVNGLRASAFEEAIAGGDLLDHLGTVGVALLELTLDESDAFAHVRMRFAFPPAWWRRRPQDLYVDAEQLAARVLACHSDV